MTLLNIIWTVAAIFLFLKIQDKVKYLFERGDPMLYPYYWRRDIKRLTNDRTKLGAKYLKLSKTQDKADKRGDKNEVERIKKEFVKIDCYDNALEKKYYHMIHSNFRILTGEDNSVIEKEPEYTYDFLRKYYEIKVKDAFKEQGWRYSETETDLYIHPLI